MNTESERVLLALRDYVNTGSVGTFFDSTPTAATQLYELACCYDATELQKLCLAYMKSHINDQNCIATLIACQGDRPDPVATGGLFRVVMKFVKTKKSKLFDLPDGELILTLDRDFGKKFWQEMLKWP